MKKYKKLFRTTLDKSEDLPLSGIYIIAYLGKILYVGMTSIGIANRISEHISAFDSIGMWLYLMQPDWENIRLDVLEIPDVEDRHWLRQTEGLLIKRFNPLFNEQF